MTEPSKAADTEAQALLVVDAEDREFVEQIFATEGVRAAEIDQDGFLDPVTISFVILGTVTAIATVNYLIEQHKGGQVFDLRPGAPRLAYRSKDIVYGLVMIIAADGKATVEVHEPRGMFGQVIDALRDVVLGLGKAGIAQVGAAVKQTVGDKANVQVEPVTA